MKYSNSARYFSNFYGNRKLGRKKTEPMNIQIEGRINSPRREHLSSSVTKNIKFEHGEYGSFNFFNFYRLSR
jgi:hypothetical protein